MSLVDRSSCCRATPPTHDSGGHLVAPCTTRVRGLASEVPLDPGDDQVPLPSVVNLDSVESVSVGTLTERLGRLGDERMRDFCAALAVAVDCRR